MHKAENGLVHPFDDSAEEEISVVTQCLAEVGFSTVDQEWLVEPL